MSRNIIALSGPRACGKSTIANHLVNNHGYTHIAFADALRDIARCAGDQFIDDRDYLARLGATLREILPSFLLEAVRQTISEFDGPIIIEDIRFPAEVEFCKSIGATTFRFEISREEQLRRLASRDGKTGTKAEILLDCMDENLLEEVDSWDHTFLAEGDFKDLASKIHISSLRKIKCRDRAYELSGVNSGAREVA